MIKKISILLVVALAIMSCAASKNVTYFQDLPKQDTSWQILKGDFIRTQPGDALSIVVHTGDHELDAQFNLPIATNRITSSESTSSNNSQGVSQYTISREGIIKFPVLGDIMIEGMTRQEIEEKIKTELTDANLVKDPVVIVEFSNMYISVLGDVSHPGRFAIDRDKVTVLDAIGKAGDLTITGKRRDVLVLRTEDKVQKAYRLDLCNASTLYSSPVFYVKQNDIIYVTPNKKQVRQATVNGNNVLSASFWISVTSAVLSLTTTIIALTK